MHKSASSICLLDFSGARDFKSDQKHITIVTGSSEARDTAWYTLIAPQDLFCKPCPLSTPDAIIARIMYRPSGMLG